MLDMISSNNSNNNLSNLSNIANKLAWDNNKLDAMKTLALWVKTIQKTLPNVPISTSMNNEYNTINANTMNMNTSEQPIALVSPLNVAQLGVLQDLEGFLATQRLTSQNDKDNGLPVEKQFLLTIDYSDGCAAIDGIPIWERFEGETTDEFELFKLYKEGFTKATKHEQPRLLRNRSVFQVVASSEVSSTIILILKDMYHWAIRANAYDEYQKLVKERLKRELIRDMEGEHQKTARRLFTQATEFIEQNITNFDGKTVLQLLDMSTKLERLSLGLPGNAPASNSQRINEPQLIQINGAGNVNIANQNINNSTDGLKQADGGDTASEILAILVRAGALKTLMSDADAEDLLEVGVDGNVMTDEEIKERAAIEEQEEEEEANAAYNKRKQTQDSFTIDNGPSAGIDPLKIVYINGTPISSFEKELADAELHSSIDYSEFEPDTASKQNIFSSQRMERR